MAGLAPTVTGALIAGGAALVGFATSAWQNRSTLRANHEIAREQRIWEKRCAVYEQVVAALNTVPTTLTKQELQDPNRGERAALRNKLASHKGQMDAYASEYVLDRFDTVMHRLSDLHLHVPSMWETRDDLSALFQAIRVELQPPPQPRIGDRFRRSAAKRRQKKMLDKYLAGLP